MSAKRNGKLKDSDPGACTPDQWPDDIHDLEDLVDLYKRECLQSYRDHLVWYRQLKEEEAAEDELRRAVIWKFNKGCHGHQRRVSKGAKEQAAKSLTLPLPPVNNFHTLIEAIHGMIGSISGIGEMTVFDAANRLRIMYNLPKPKFIYLHRGARQGAKGLGLDYRKRFLIRDELPPNSKAAFKELKGDEIEDFLCVCKDRLHGAVKEG